MRDGRRSRGRSLRSSSAVGARCPRRTHRAIFSARHAPSAPRRPSRASERRGGRFGRRARSARRAAPALPRSPTRRARRAGELASPAGDGRETVRAFSRSAALLLAAQSSQRPTRPAADISRCRPRRRCGCCRGRLACVSDASACLRPAWCTDGAQGRPTRPWSLRSSDTTRPSRLARAAWSCCMGYSARVRTGGRSARRWRGRRADLSTASFVNPHRRPLDASGPPQPRSQSTCRAFRLRHDGQRRLALLCRQRAARCGAYRAFDVRRSARGFLTIAGAARSL